jgi:putative transcriptional regulator
MEKEVFKDLMDSLQEVLEHVQGKRVLRTTRLPLPPPKMGAKDVRMLRERVNASQSVFAHGLNVSVKLVQAWEGNRRIPDGPALKLMHLAQTNPEMIFGSQGQTEGARNGKG